MILNYKYIIRIPIHYDKKYDNVWNKINKLSYRWSFRNRGASCNQWKLRCEWVRASIDSMMNGRISNWKSLVAVSNTSINICCFILWRIIIFVQRCKCKWMAYICSNPCWKSCFTYLVSCAYTMLEWYYQMGKQSSCKN